MPGSVTVTRHRWPTRQLGLAPLPRAFMPALPRITSRRPSKRSGTAQTPQPSKRPACTRRLAQHRRPADRRHEWPNHVLRRSFHSPTGKPRPARTSAQSPHAAIQPKRRHSAPRLRQRPALGTPANAQQPGTIRDPSGNQRGQCLISPTNAPRRKSAFRDRASLPPPNARIAAMAPHQRRLRVAGHVSVSDASQRSALTAPNPANHRLSNNGNTRHAESFCQIRPIPRWPVGPLPWKYECPHGFPFWALRAMGLAPASAAAPSPCVLANLCLNQAQAIVGNLGKKEAP